MKLLLNVYHSHPDAEGCEYAYLDLTPELCALILRRAATFESIQAADVSLTETQYHSISPVWLDRLPDVDGADEPPWGEAYAETSLTEDQIKPHIAMTECDRMVIANRDVYWTCVPKHRGWTAETRPVPYTLIRQIAATPATLFDVETQP